jgi:hypothetical protein
MPRNIMVTKPGREMKAIIMRSAIAIGETEQKGDDGCPHVAFTLFSFDLQGLDGLGCKF